jgi:hypothetical protein
MKIAMPAAKLLTSNTFIFLAPKIFHLPGRK